MKEEAQRIKIAEACGWKYDPTASPDMKYVGIMCWIRPGNSEWQTEQVPDYLNSLDAMHAAEKALDTQQRESYFWNLLDATSYKGPVIDGLDGNNGGFELISMPAAQRAEALLRTLNLWEDEHTSQPSSI